MIRKRKKVDNFEAVNEVIIELVERIEYLERIQKIMYYKADKHARALNNTNNVTTDTRERKK